jgi:hypothetical protein
LFRAGEFLFKLVDALLQVIIEREIDPRSPRADFSPHLVKRRANALDPQRHRAFPGAMSTISAGPRWQE